jgi:3-isopropylmalate dehydrogenase
VHYLNTAEVLPENVHYACRNSHAILFGAMGLPDLRGTDGTEIVPQLDLRFALDLYAGVRPIRPWARLPSPLASPRASEIELVLVRENTEGLFYARGRGEVTPDAALDTMRISRKGTARICDFAFALAGRRRARGGRGHVTNVDKASVFRSRD